MDTPIETEDPIDPSSAEVDGQTERSAFSNRSIAIAVGGALLVIVLAFAIFSSSDSTGNAGVDVASADGGFNSFVFLTSDGSTGSLADYAGEPLVVNFFASWCGPCRAELPEFEQASQLNKEAVTFLGISHDLDEVTWRSFVAETSVTYDTVFQPDQELFEALDAKGMPTTVFISPEGEVLQIWSGILSQEKLQELIDVNLVEA